VCVGYDSINFTNDGVICVMKTATVIFCIAVIGVGLVGYTLRNTGSSPEPAIRQQALERESSNNTIDTASDQSAEIPTERYSAQVDRVKVLFEQWDYTRYRLQTNELVREGEMNSERGFGDDPDATVYVLNWQAPEGEQIRYVRLTAEPGYLYALDGYQNIIKSGRLVLEQ
jgi:hypothetical protein